MVLCFMAHLDTYLCLRFPWLVFSLLGNVILPPNCCSNLGQCYLLTMLAVDRVHSLFLLFTEYLACCILYKYLLGGDYRFYEVSSFISSCHVHHLA